MKISLSRLAIPADKANHFVYGALICAAVMLITQSPVVAMAICVIVAAGKEVYDLVSGKGESSVLDFLWTILGGAIVAFI